MNGQLEHVFLSQIQQNWHHSITPIHGYGLAPILLRLEKSLCLRYLQSFVHSIRGSKMVVNFRCRKGGHNLSRVKIQYESTFFLLFVGFWIGGPKPLFIRQFVVFIFFFLAHYFLVHRFGHSRKLYNIF